MISANLYPSLNPPSIRFLIQRLDPLRRTFIFDREPRLIPFTTSCSSLTIQSLFVFDNRIYKLLSLYSSSASKMMISGLRLLPKRKWQTHREWKRRNHHKFTRLRPNQSHSGRSERLGRPHEDAADTRE